MRENKVKIENRREMRKRKKNVNHTHMQPRNKCVRIAFVHKRTSTIFPNLFLTNYQIIIQSDQQFARF